MNSIVENLKVLLGAVLYTGAACACGAARANAPDGTRPALPTLAPLGGIAVLEKAAQRYASAMCYEDVGTVKSPAKSSDANCSLEFWTSFRRNKYFKFSFRDGCNGMRAGFEYADARTKIWHEVGGKREEFEDQADDSFKGAVERFAGTSKGVSRLVPVLLFAGDAFGLRASSTHVLDVNIGRCGYDECYSVLVQNGPSARTVYDVDRDFILRGVKSRIWSAGREWTASTSISASCLQNGNASHNP